MGIQQDNNDPCTQWCLGGVSAAQAATSDPNSILVISSHQPHSAPSWRSFLFPREDQWLLSSRPWTSRTESVWRRAQKNAGYVKLAQPLVHSFYIVGHLRACWLFLGPSENIHNKDFFLLIYFPYRHLGFYFCILKDSYTWSKYSK